MAETPASIPVRVLSRLARVVYLRRHWFILPQLILAAACIWYTVARLEFSVDRNDLVGSDQEYHRNFLELKREFTIVIVTHNMQQAARISDYTAFFYLGELVEFDRTAKIFTNPSKKQTEDYVTGRFG